LVAAALHGNITVKGLDVNSTQADKKIMQALEQCAANYSWQGADLVFTKKGNLQPFVFNATECPDLFPPLAALAAAINGKTVIKGTSRLKHKESDRALTLQQEYKKLGVDIVLEKDDMVIHGTGIIGAGTVSSCNDHRIAMACAVSATMANDTVVITEAEAINKSYPNFYEHLALLGAQVQNISE
jgi:3-phosphoshikimate 1-carboxyvinyltransferase